MRLDGIRLVKGDARTIKRTKALDSSGAQRDVEAERARCVARTGRKDGKISGPGSLIDHVETTGWAPTCKCKRHRPVPCTVLDPFGGAGTTALAARSLGRDCVIVEKKPDYLKIAARRLAA